MGPSLPKRDRHIQVGSNRGCPGGPGRHEGFSDGSAIDGSIGTATVLYRDSELKSKLRKQLVGEDQHMVFEAELVGLSLATKLVRVEGNVHSAIISSDSQVVIWVTRSMRGELGGNLVDRVHEQLEAVMIRHSGMRIEFRGTPGHEGIHENKQADAEARRAAWGDLSWCHQLPLSCRGAIPASKSPLQQEHMKWEKAQVKELFAESLRCRRI